MNEVYIERKVCKYAKEKGILGLKLVDNGGSGFPDRTFLGKDGLVFFIEFKYKNNKLSEVQKIRRTHLTERGFKYYVVYTYEEGKQIIDLLINNNKGLNNE